MADMMMFPKTVDEFMEKYKIVDSDEVYTNGAELVPIFRIKQWFEHVDACSVRHGRWKRSKFYKNIIFCDECGEPFELSNSLEHWNYCPNCGAKMDGERREDAKTD